MKKEQLAEVKKIYNLLRSNKNFSLVRFADGERLFIEGKKGAGIDGWSSPSRVTKLGQELLASLHLAVDEKCLIGISDDINDPLAKLFYSNILFRADSNNITMSNIFVNGTYDFFLNKICKELQEKSSKIILICNKKARLTNIEKFFPGSKVYFGPSHPSEFWEHNSQKWKNFLLSIINREKDSIFLFALGPISSISIPFMANNNSLNTYIDIGSALDPLLYGKNTRPYHDTRSPDRKQLVHIDVQDNIQLTPPDSSISCILNCYKRHDLVLAWLDAALMQSLKPDEIHILFNTMPPAELLEILRDKLNQGLITNIVVSDSNLGVWNRFSYALNCKTEYICIFDDDTIPGKKWLMNCFNQMSSHIGVYGTVGLVLDSKKVYMNHIRYGWPSPSDKTHEVDLVGHSWFFKREWLSVYWNDLPPVSGFDFMGEDMHLSYAVQKYLDLKTFVPPHPISDKELWGSTRPERGQDFNAISMTGKASKMNYAISRLFKMGWRLIKESKE